MSLGLAYDIFFSYIWVISARNLSVCLRSRLKCFLAGWYVFMFELLAVKIHCNIGFLAAKRVFLTDPSWEM